MVPKCKDYSFQLQVQLMEVILLIQITIQLSVLLLSNQVETVIPKVVEIVKNHKTNKPQQQQQQIHQHLETTK